MTYTIRILYVYNDPVWKCTRQAYFGCQHLHQGFTAWLHTRSRRQGPLLTQCFSSKAPQQQRICCPSAPTTINNCQRLSWLSFQKSKIEDVGQLDDIGIIGGQEAQDRLISFGFWHIPGPKMFTLRLSNRFIHFFTLTLHFKFQSKRTYIGQLNIRKYKKVLQSWRILKDAEGQIGAARRVHLKQLVVVLVWVCLGLGSTPCSAPHGHLASVLCSPGNKTTGRPDTAARQATGGVKPTEPRHRSEPVRTGENRSESQRLRR